jgi:translation initiation factor 2 beta subunit (eIF-2beta)/eIF-5
MENIVSRKCEVFDPHYRYKMPKMLTVFRKNCTMISNLDDLTKSLNRSSDEILKMFSYHLGTHVKGQSLSGTYTYEKLHEILMAYIEENILCSECSNPETIYKMHKKKLCLDCQACAGRTQLSQDTKLTKYIMSKLP